jgi:hypothetical protein
MIAAHQLALLAKAGTIPRNRASTLSSRRCLANVPSRSAWSPKSFAVDVHRIFRGSFGNKPPYPIGSDVLFVAYYSSAELSCYRALNWPMPLRVLDLFCEFRNHTNGLPTPAGAGLLGALAYFHLDGINATEKHDLQEALGTGTWSGRYSAKEILDYCASDVAALERLLEAMLPEIDLPRALLRGRYMVAVSAMEFAGTPIDMPMLARLRESWDGIQDRLIAGIDTEYGVYDGRSFRADQFAEWLIRRGIPWPRLESGHLDLSDDTFRQMAKSHPAVSPLRELRSALSELRLNDLAVGRDARSLRFHLHRVRAISRLPRSFRSIRVVTLLIRRRPLRCGLRRLGVKEFAIAAAFFGDVAMQAPPGDPHLALGGRPDSRRWHQSNAQCHS